MILLTRSSVNLVVIACPVNSLCSTRRLYWDSDFDTRTGTHCLSLVEGSNKAAMDHAQQPAAALKRFWTVKLNGGLRFGSRSISLHRRQHTTPSFGPVGYQTRHKYCLCVPINLRRLSRSIDRGRGKHCSAIIRMRPVLAVHPSAGKAARANVYSCVIESRC